MYDRQAGRPEDFGEAFSQLLEASGLNPDAILVRLGEDRRLVSRTTLYDWKNGAHLPEDTGLLLRIVRVCLQAAQERA